MYQSQPRSTHPSEPLDMQRPCPTHSRLRSKTAAAHTDSPDPALPSSSESSDSDEEEEEEDELELLDVASFISPLRTAASVASAVAASFGSLSFIARYHFFDSLGRPFTVLRQTCGQTRRGGVSLHSVHVCAHNGPP